MSRPITVSIPHKLGAAEARRRLEQGLGRLEQQLAGVGVAQMKKEWQGERLIVTARALGQAITARADILADAVNLEIDLPEILALFADKLRGRLQKEGKLLLEKK